MKLIGRFELMERLGVASAQTVDNLEKRGLLPQRIRVSPGRVMWDEAEVEKALANRPRGIRAHLKGGPQ
jgi:predicted DNA-binding transcriptional regulator AlpA